jgi:hypothetical protein
MNTSPPVRAQLCASRQLWRPCQPIVRIACDAGTGPSLKRGS